MDVTELTGFDGFFRHSSFESDEHNWLGNVIGKFNELVRCGFELEGLSNFDGVDGYANVFGTEVRYETLPELHDFMQWAVDDAWEHMDDANVRQVLWGLRRVYLDCSVDTELVTEPIELKDIEKHLNFWLWFLERCGVTASPDYGAGCHMTVSLKTVYVPSFVRANIEQLVIYFTPALALLSWLQWDHCNRDWGYFELNTGFMDHYGNGYIHVSGEEKYRFVHFKNFPDCEGFEFRYPDASMNARHLWRVAIVNMALVLKALKISHEHKAIVEFKCDTADIIDDLNEIGDVKGWIERLHSHLNEFLAFIRPEIEEITGDYHRWLEGIFDVDSRRYYDAEPERYGIIVDDIQTSEDWGSVNNVGELYDDNGALIGEPSECLDDAYLIDERYNEVISE
ncbi:MAG: hypothetical protein DRJ03_07965 [Chloroflexi bacterium]|nr:MAG: hypothetical protein DRJ03_07965 [Chloroflexota bacterium]